ncbi:4Fe-4S binding protein [Desulfomarina sp.]
MTTFPGCLLIEKNNTEPEIIASEFRLDSGNKPVFTIDSSGTVLLAGGFPSFFSQSAFPFSVTLQLNHDRTSLDGDGLLRIALAERRRLDSVFWHSYISEVDTRVCVIGTQAAHVEKFLDTYGGVLDIEPLLLQELHPEIPTAADLRIAGNDNGLRLEYDVRLPLSVRECTYCGACGPVCPERCISPRLFLDLSRCSLCGECEKVCNTKAIDINRIEERVMTVPALIILDDSRLEVEEGVANVYYENELEKFFSTLFSCQVDEPIVWDGSVCQYSPRLDAGCDLCVRSCSYGAVSRGGDGIAINSFACEECGACVGACPTGALQNGKFNDPAFVSFFETVDFARGTTVVIGSEEQLHELWWQSGGQRYDNLFFLEYPGSANLSLFHFLFLLLRGAGRLVLLTGNQEGRELRNQAGLANSLVTSLYGGGQRIFLSNVGEAEKLFAGLSPLERIEEGKDTGGYTNRRKELAEELKRLVAGSGKSGTVRPETSLAFATLSCDSDRCTHCLACLNGCRIGALSGDEENLSLNHVGVMCIGCGLCVQICPENALGLAPEFTLNNDFFTPEILAKAEAMTCRSCGKVFGTRKSYERVMAILAEKESVDTTHFEYCETCRVVRLFED